MGLISRAFQNSPGFSVGGMTNQAAPNAQPQGMGSLQSFMASLGQPQAGGNFAPTYMRPPTPTNPFALPSHLAPNDFGPIDPSAVRHPTGYGPRPGDTVHGYGSALSLPGVNIFQPEGYGIFRSNSPQNGYPTWDNAGSQQPIADAVSGLAGGLINPFGIFGGGGGGSPAGGAGEGGTSRSGSEEATVIKRNKS